MTGGHPGAAVGTPPDLQASASRRTGLTDFGDDDYADGLAVLLQACEREAALTAPGAKALRSFLRGALIARLFSQAAWTAHPHYTAVPEGVMKYAQFMHDIGTLKASPTGWKDFFFPPILDRPGS